MAVASFQTAAVVYREEQNFDWRAYALLAAAEVLVIMGFVWLERRGHDAARTGPLGALTLPAFAALGLTVPPLACVGLFRMTTEVTPTEVRVWFGWVPTYRRAFAVSAVQKIEVVSYRPFADYGGWGVRVGRDGERVFNARGNRGVRLHFADGGRVLIGSQKPEALADAIERAVRPGV